MKNRDILEKLNKMSSEDLEKELLKAYTEARRERLQVEARKSSDSAEANNKRKYIARILTILNSRDEE